MTVRHFLILIASIVAFSVHAQEQSVLDQKIDISVQEVTFAEVLDAIKGQVEVDFSYYSEIFQDNQRFTVNRKGQTVGQILDFVLTGTAIYYGVFKGQVIFYLPKRRPGSIHTISGKLVDSLTNAAIDQAHVYLDQTDIGTLTDVNGNFTLKSIPSGAYDLVISHLTYGVYNYVLNVTKDEDDVIIRVAPKITLLPELEVISVKDNQFNQYVDMFKREVLGVSQNARSCVINNPEDILVYRDSTHLRDEFEIFTKKPLLITNRSLGYQIQYDLVFFESKNSQTLFIGRSNFMPMVSPDKRQMNRWRRNRMISYRGSLRDFVATENKEDGKASIYKRSVVNKIPNSLQFKYFPADIKSKDVLQLVALSKELQEGRYMEVYHKRMKKESYISKADFEFKADYKYKLIRDYFDPKRGVIIYGYWATRRLGDTLPLNFLVSLGN